MANKPPAWMFKDDGNRPTTGPVATQSAKGSPLPLPPSAPKEAAVAVSNQPVVATSVHQLPQASQAARPAPAPNPDELQWQPVLVSFLERMAKEIISAGFSNWSKNPKDVIALVLSESGGRWTATTNEGTSSKLGRAYYSSGLLQMSELTASYVYGQRSKLLGANGQKNITPWPTSPTWTAEQARAILTRVPDQLWYAMALLRSFLQMAATYFSSLSTTAKGKPGKSPGPELAAELNRLSTALKIPASAVALKAYWLASSAEGMLKLCKASDPRLTKYASIWKTI